MTRTTLFWQCSRHVSWSLLFIVCCVGGTLVLNERLYAAVLDVTERARIVSVEKALSVRDAPYSRYCEVRPRGEQQLDNFNKKVISYSLFLPNTTNASMPDWLMTGVKENAKAARLIYPEWVLRIYTLNIDDSTIQAILEIDDKRVEVVRCHDDSVLNQPFVSKSHVDKTAIARKMLPRFLAIDDPTVAVMISRDVDSRLHIRELLAVNEWLSSDHHFHSMRDHYRSHPQSILGGMWGVKRGWGYNMTQLMDECLTSYQHVDMQGGAGYDQNFLHHFVWPLVKGDTLSHDDKIPRCRKHGSALCKHFPIGPSNIEENYFVGAAFVDENWNRSIECNLQCKLV